VTIPEFPETKVALKGRKGLIVGIATSGRSPGAAPRHSARWAPTLPSPI